MGGEVVLTLAVGVGLIWCWLLYRAVSAEYRYYRAVQTLLPDVWQSLGAPRGAKVPCVFLSPKKKRHLETIENKVVLSLAQRHHRTGRQFLMFVVVTLLVAVVGLKVAAS